MNPEVKALWLEALRSGEYNQATNWLKTDSGYCCLGVLCDLAAKQGIGEWVNDGRWRFKTPTQVGSQFMPQPVIDWAGLDIPQNPIIGTDINGRQVAATIANDELKWTFEQIADGIEVTL